MSDPRRLTLEPSSELAGTLLRAGRARAPDEARKRAVLLATATLAASGIVAGTSGAATAGGTVAKGASAAMLHWIGLAGLLGAGAVTAAVAVGHRRDAVPTRTELATPAAQSASVPSRRSVAQPRPRPSVQIEAPGAETSSTPKPTGAPGADLGPPPAQPASSMRGELSTLEQARAMLSAGNPARALSILDDYAARFPHASMAPEATVLRIEALVRAGDAPAARRVADVFLAANPDSPYADRIRSLLGDNP